MKMGDHRLLFGWRAVSGRGACRAGPFFGRSSSDAACAGVVVVVGRAHPLVCGVGSARCAGQPCLAAVFASTHLDGCARPDKSSGGDHPLVGLRHVCCSVAGVVVAGAAAMSSLVSALSALVACGCSRVDMGLGRTGAV